MAKIKIKKEIRYHGTAIVEMAIVITLLLYLTLGVIEYGWLFLKSQQITNAARQATRAAIRQNATNSQVTDIIEVLMAQAGMAWEDSNYTVGIPADISSVEAGNALTITITAPCANIALINAPDFLPTPGEIEAVVTMAKEG
jgi:Flp pilus assembly protein TadG